MSDEPDPWTLVRETVENVVNGCYGTDPRHGLMAMAAADKIVHGKPIPWSLASHFGADVPRNLAPEQTLTVNIEHGVQVGEAIVGPIDDMAGYQRGELAATHRRKRLRFSDHVGEWEPVKTEVE